MSEIERLTGMPRDEIQDLLPDWVAGRLGPEAAERVERAVRVDHELEREAETLALLHRSRPRPPEGLEGRIVRAIRTEGAPQGASRGRRVGGAWTWSLAAAALLALSLGTLELMDRGPAEEPSGSAGGLEQLAYEEVGSPWSDDAVIAGAPVLDGLSEDALTTLLEELDG